ncbi:MAG TPA: class A beta-lactamase-related serine hydrolase [Companilactobacillus farciminis]|uniref:Class A beta-lactamase-related serine hydrolase n=1 Tax=Companilactobacillus farciminis TaxID=1612 RepID=A0A921HSV5_9LACO|nr:class A beta-lactamase-related serine hydrolase [Companilactobacillus farciminis]
MVCLLVAGFSYYHNNSQASTNSNDNSKVTKAIKKKRKIIKTNLTNYLNTVTADGTASVSFYNLGNDDSNSNSEYNQVYQDGSLEVESNASTVKTAASTYKLYLSAFLMGQKQNGNFSWTSDNNTGFTKMIVNSENDFAEEQIDNYGADTISSYLKQQGYYDNVFEDGQAAQTTSYSLELLLRDLANGTGSFENSSDQQKLLNLMGKQIYRTGIPTGVAQANSGTTVQDKVGFLDDTNNDAAIVTLPNGQKYVLVIMTNGHNQSGLSGFSRIAEIAKNVQKIVYGKNAGEKIVNYSNN